MRCFIAVEMDEAIQDQLRTAQEWFADIGGKVGWCEREQMHLTVTFLGEVGDEVRPKVVEVMRAAAREVPRFELVVEGVGAFPPSGAPRVLWVGLRPCEPLGRLHELLESGCEPLGFSPEDRAFTPHLTLGRVKERVDVRRCREILDAHKGFRAGVQAVRTIILFSSTLKPTGSVYSVVEEISLGS